jgi:hypothetical protein
VFRSALIAIGVTLLTFVVTRQWAISAILGGVVIAALMVRDAQRNQPKPVQQDAGFEPLAVPAHTTIELEPESTVPEPPAEPTPQDVAMTLGRRELGQTGEREGDIEFTSALGPSRIRVGFHTEVPFIALRQTLGDERELTFVVRRRKSMLGLPRVVDNTPVDTANFEYRLRTIPLPDQLEQKFEAATNRPRLFRELVAGGLETDLEYLLYDPSHRLEDLTYGGDSLTMLIQPANDPTMSPWVHDTLAFARPVTARIRNFLDSAHIPSAKS